MRRPPNLTKFIAAAETAPAPSGSRLPADYLELYGLANPPFGRPDNDGFILFRSRKRAFEQLADHLVNGSGLVLVQGAEGIGKTASLMSAAAVATDSGLRTILVPRPPDGSISLAQLLSAISEGHDGDMTVVARAKAQDDPENAEPDEAETLQAITERAIESFLAPPRKTLLADDIDLMPPDCVRLVRSLVQRIPDAPGAPAAVLTSSTDLTDVTKRPDLSSIVTLARKTIRLSPLKHAEVHQYIERSLWMSGGTPRRLIEPDALKLLIARSDGVPGAINRLMETAFTTGFARGDPTITAKTIGAAPAAPRRRYRPAAASGMASLVFQIVSAGLLVTGAAVFFYKALNSDTEPAKHDAPSVAAASPSVATPPAAPPPVAAAPTAAPFAPAPAMPAQQSVAAVKPTEAVSANLMAVLMKRGDQSLELGDIAAARLLYQRAAEGGNPAAATALGKTYDPAYVPIGVKPDPGRAADWYRKAINAGDARAADLLKRLASH